LQFEFSVGGRRHAVRLDGKPPKATVTVDGGEGRRVDWVAIPGGVVSMVVDGRSRAARVARRDGGLSVWVEGRRFDLDLGAADDAAGAAKGGGRGSGVVKAPMPGTVVKVLVKEGDAVEVGRSLVIVEAMKMEHDVRAAVAGTVKKVAVVAGASVGTTEAMVEIEPSRADG
jgi:biotin carboxyl carrier protein